MVIEQALNSKWGSYRWLCLCDCKNEKIVRGSDLQRGMTKSCGCLHKEIITIHGHNKRERVSRIYQTWTSMIRRCTNRNDQAYERYGGRGIKVCKQWMEFENFLKDMSEKPTDKHQIDRIDNNGNYCKSNCRWATRKQQQRNKRNNHLITFEGRTQCVTAWAEEFNIHKGTLRSRIYTYGWSIGKAITTPVKKIKKTEKINDRN